RTREALKRHGLEGRAQAIEGLHIVDPVGYLDALVLEKNAALVLTDSGGLQEESCFLRVPCVTLRENTELPETIESRASVLAGTETRGKCTVHRVRFRAPYNRPSLAWKLRGWWRRAFRLLRTILPDGVQAAEWDMIPPALRARDAWGAKVVFDIWDYYAQMI